MVLDHLLSWHTESTPVHTPSYPLTFNRCPRSPAGAFRSHDQLQVMDTHRFIGLGIRCLFFLDFLGVQKNRRVLNPRGHSICSDLYLLQVFSPLPSLNMPQHICFQSTFQAKDKPKNILSLCKSCQLILECLVGLKTPQKQNKAKT